MIVRDKCASPGCEHSAYVCPAHATRLYDALEARVEKVREWCKAEIARQNGFIKEAMQPLDPMAVLLSGARSKALKEVLALLDGKDIS